jgi:hypothetical protein
MTQGKAPDLAQVRKVKEKVEDKLLKLPGVTGVSIGYKVVGGRTTDQLAIRVYVRRKRGVPPDQAIPAEIDGVPTDIVQADFHLQGG